MVTVAIYEAHHGSGKQTIKLGAAFMRRHAVRVQGIGAWGEGLIDHHGSLVQFFVGLCDLGTGQPQPWHQK